jgi:hypothetical protein
VSELRIQTDVWKMMIRGRGSRFVKACKEMLVFWTVLN